MIISFLASHGGSSAKAIIAAIQRGDITAEVGIVITNNRDSAIFHWCLDNDIPVRHISSKTHRGEDNADEAISTVLVDMNTDLVICSGYMKRVGEHTLRHFPEHIMNIHPALLPAYGGQGMYGDHVHRAVLANGEAYSGASVHLVTAGIDEGPIVLQETVAVNPEDTVESLRARVQSIEPGLYINAIKRYLSGNGGHPQERSH